MDLTKAWYDMKQKKPYSGQCVMVRRVVYRVGRTNSDGNLYSYDTITQDDSGEVWCEVQEDKIKAMQALQAASCETRSKFYNDNVEECEKLTNALFNDD